MSIEAKELNKVRSFVINIKLSDSQIKLIEYIIKRERFGTRWEIALKAILDYCEQKVRFYEAQDRIEKEFIEEYKHMRKTYLEAVNDFEKLRKEMVYLLPEKDRGKLREFKKETEEDKKERIEDEENKRLEMEMLEEKEKKEDEFIGDDYNNEEDEEDGEDEDEDEEELEGIDEKEYVKEAKEKLIEEQPFKEGDLHG